MAVEPEINSEKLTHLLKETKNIVEDQIRIEKLKGERFNIFSILGMERLENATHSAMIGELLNPKGSHLKGDLFLSLFLEVVGYYETQVFKMHGFDILHSGIQLEKHIGLQDISNKTGGRVDVYVYSRGISICIENKIYAGDQDMQIERYCNHNKGKNTVYYLTLFGEEPSLVSKGKLENGKDFYMLSYKETILDWLERCLKEAVESPILRESIKQYIILIKKLTGTMDKTHEDKLYTKILENYVEADWIAKNVEKARLILCEQIREAVIHELKKGLNTDEFEVVKGNSIGDKFAQIWIKPKGIESPKHYFGIESFNGKGHKDGNIFIGITNFSRANYALDALEYTSDIGGVWFNIMEFGYLEGDGTLVNLRHIEKIQRLNNDNAFKNQFIEHIVVVTRKYIESEYPKFERLLELKVD